MWWRGNIKVGVLALNRAGAGTPGLSVGFDFFHVSVPAVQQIESLDDYVGFLGLDAGLTNDLQNKLDAALDQLDSGKGACKKLDDFVATVRDRSGKNNPKLTADEAEQLLYANQIEIDLGCPDPT